MFKNDTRKLFCFLASLLGVVLIGFGVFLLATGFGIEFITIGVIVSGILLLIAGCLGKCVKAPCLVCLLLTLITLFLIISGILALLFGGGLIVPLILIGLGILSLLLTVVCLIFNLCKVIVYKGSAV